MCHCVGRVAQVQRRVAIVCVSVAMITLNTGVNLFLPVPPRLTLLTPGTLCAVKTGEGVPQFRGRFRRWLQYFDKISTVL